MKIKNKIITLLLVFTSSVAKTKVNFCRADLLSGLKPATHFAALATLLMIVLLLAACNGGGSSSSSSRASTPSGESNASGESTSSAPVAPSSLSWSVISAAIVIDWSDVAGATYYSVRRNGRLLTLGVTQTTISFTDRDIGIGNSYSYEVTACNQVGCSAVVGVVVDYSVPASPVALVVSGNSNVISLDWDDVNGADSYQVSRLGANSVDTTVAVSSYNDFSVRSGNEYTYVVMACNDIGCSSARTVVVDYTVPSRPLITTWSVVNGNILLDWGNVAGIERYTVSRDGRSLTSGTILTASSYTDTTAVLGREYDYEVTACNQFICSSAASVDIDYSVPSIPNLGGSLTSVDDVTDNVVGRSYELNGARSVTTAAVGDNTYLFVAGEIDDGVSVFTVQTDGSLTGAFDVTDGDNTNFRMNGARSVTTADIDGDTELYVVGFVDDGITVFDVDNEGSLTYLGNRIDTTASNFHLDGASSVTTLLPEGGTTRCLFASGYNDNGVNSFAIVSGLPGRGDVSDTVDFELEGATSITTAEVGGSTYLFVAGYDDDGVSVFRVPANCSLSSVFDVTDSANTNFRMNGASSVTTAVVEGTTYLFVAGELEDGITVFRVNDGGSLTYVDNVVDSGSLELNGARSVTTALVGGTTYLFVAGFWDDGVSVFRVDAAGSLTSVDDVTDSGSLELAGASSVTTAAVGSNTYLFAAGYDDDGVSVFRVTPPPITGSVVNADDILLDWDDVADADYYTVRRAGPGGSLLTSGTTNTASSFTDFNIDIDNSYKYEVTACNRVGCGDPVSVIVN